MHINWKIIPGLRGLCGLCGLPDHPSLPSLPGLPGVPGLPVDCFINYDRIQIYSTFLWTLFQIHKEKNVGTGLKVMGWTIIWSWARGYQYKR